MAKAKKPKDLDPKAKGAQVKGGANIIDSPSARRKFVQRVLRRPGRAVDGATKG